MMNNDFISSGQLMETVRKLDYKGQYKVCYAFYDAIIKYPRWDNNRFCLLFDDIYESIDPEMLDEEILKIRQCVNEMDNVLSEMDEREPGTFCELAEEIEKLIDNNISVPLKWDTNVYKHIINNYVV